MKKIKVVCHMMTTIDGKISIDWDGNDDYGVVGEEYDRLIFEYGNIYGCGRATYQYLPETDLSAYKGIAVEYKDFVVKPAADEVMTVAFDRFGKLRWESNLMEYGGRKVKVMEVITKQVKPEFLAYLKEKEIPFIFAGENDFDPKLFLSKLSDYFGAETFVLCGGAEINAVFMSADLVDEISIVVGAAIDGTRDALTFVGGTNTEAFPKYFHLKDVKRVGQDGVVLYYTK